MIKGVIFDCDGVLCDTHTIWVAAYRKVARMVGVKRYLSEKFITRGFGDTYWNVLQSIVGEHKIKKAYPLLMNYINSDEWLEKLKTLPYTEQILTKFKSKGLKLAVASGNTHKVLQRTVGKVGITKYFDALVSASEVEKSKPAPDILIKAARKLSIPSEHLIYVGDAANDVRAAKSAGIRVASMLTGALDRNLAESLSPNWILNDLSELLPIVEAEI